MSQESGFLASLWTMPRLGAEMYAQCYVPSREEAAWALSQTFCAAVEVLRQTWPEHLELLVEHRSPECAASGVPSRIALAAYSELDLAFELSPAGFTGLVATLDMGCIEFAARVGALATDRSSMPAMRAEREALAMLAFPQALAFDAWVDPREILTSLKEYPDGPDRYWWGQLPPRDARPRFEVTMEYER